MRRAKKMNGNRFAVVKRKCKQEKTRHFKPSQAKHKKEEKTTMRSFTLDAKWIINDAVMTLMKYFYRHSVWKCLCHFECACHLSMHRFINIEPSTVYGKHEMLLPLFETIEKHRSMKMFICSPFRFERKNKCFFHSKKTIFCLRTDSFDQIILFSWYWRFLNKTRSNIWLQTKHFPICNCNLNGKLVYFRKKDV